MIRLLVVFMMIVMLTSCSSVSEISSSKDSEETNPAVQSEEPVRNKFDVEFDNLRNAILNYEVTPEHPHFYYEASDGSFAVGNINVATKMVLTYENAINHRYSSFESAMFTRKRQNVFAEEELAQDMTELFRDAVILNKTVTENDFYKFLYSTVDSIDRGTKEGFSRALTHVEKIDLIEMVEERIDATRTRYIRTGEYSGN